MKRTDAAGDVKSASMKCIDLDREVGKIWDPRWYNTINRFHRWKQSIIAKCADLDRKVRIKIEILFCIQLAETRHWYNSFIEVGLKFHQVFWFSSGEWHCADGHEILALISCISLTMDWKGDTVFCGTLQLLHTDLDKGKISVI